VRLSPRPASTSIVRPSVAVSTTTYSIAESYWPLSSPSRLVSVAGGYCVCSAATAAASYVTSETNRVEKSWTLKLEFICKRKVT
jgi:hypothetical protein